MNRVLQVDQPAPLVEGDIDPEETAEWLDSLEGVLRSQGPDRARFLLEALLEKAHNEGVQLPFTANTPYLNTIHVSEQPTFPGNRELERKIKNYIRWNALPMMMRANKN